ncbi:hypothetical protein FKB34_08410 [Glycocaulis profundi]|nr:hypothetical protein FKB34_08410 [Glycocaulis profundi]
MSRFATLLVLACAIMAAEPASASDVHAFAQRADALKDEAMTRSGATLSVAEPGDFEADVAAFITEARTLANTLSEHGAPSDLPCIFRGMAEDAEYRLGRLGDGDDAEDYYELGALFDEAAQIARSPDTGMYIPLPCPAAG